MAAAACAEFGALHPGTAVHSQVSRRGRCGPHPATGNEQQCQGRSEEHTSELQSRPHLVCRLLLEKKKKVAGHTGNAVRGAEVGRVVAVEVAELGEGANGPAGGKDIRDRRSQRRGVSKTETREGLV